MSLNHFWADELEVTSQHLQLFVGQNLIEEQVARVVWVELDLQSVCVGVVKRIVK